MIYKPDGFELYEYLPRDFYHETAYLGERRWLMFDRRVLWTDGQLRKRYGTTIMNDWWWGGNNQWRGWRIWECPIGAYLSQHKFGRASDKKFKNVSAEEVREDIKRDPWRFEFQFIVCVEDGVRWLHTDYRNWDKQRDGLLIV